MAEYILQKDFKFGPSSNQLTLPQGAFVFPIDRGWLPKHVIEKHTSSVLYMQYMIVNPVTDKYDYCYTHYGIIPIRHEYYRKIK